MLKSAEMRTPRDPIAALVSHGGEDGVLAIIANVEGPSYRPVGATMAVLGRHKRVGTLSSGCVEKDITLHAIETRDAGTPRLIRYGRGSPFLDIQLPCGGGLDILLLPAPDRNVLGDLVSRRAARAPCTLEIGVETGAMRLLPKGATGRDGEVLRVRFEPDLQFFVFGKGPESSTFAGLVQSAGYPSLLLSPDADTLEEAEAMGCRTRHLKLPVYPRDLDTDHRTAILLFFHDHDWEPLILKDALGTSAFYIGAQGSRRAQEARLKVLEGFGVPSDQRARLYGPVGLIPSARDSATLAVSVLAQVLQEAMARAE